MNQGTRRVSFDHVPSDESSSRPSRETERALVGRQRSEPSKLAVVGFHDDIDGGGRSKTPENMPPSARGRRLGGRISQSLKTIGRRQNLLQRAGSEPLPPSLLSSFLNTSPHLGGSSPSPGPGPGPGHDSREHAAIRRELDVYRLTHNALKRVVEEAKALPPFPPPHLPPPLPPSGGRGGGGGDDDDDDDGGAVEEERAAAAAEAPRRLLREVTVVMNVTDEMLADIQGRFSSLGTTETVTRLTKLGSEAQDYLGQYDIGRTWHVKAFRDNIQLSRAAYARTPRRSNALSTRSMESMLSDEEERGVRKDTETAGVMNESTGDVVVGAAAHSRDVTVTAAAEAAGVSSIEKETLASWEDFDALALDEQLRRGSVGGGGGGEGMCTGYTTGKHPGGGGGGGGGGGEEIIISRRKEDASAECGSEKDARSSILQGESRVLTETVQAAVARFGLLETLGVSKSKFVAFLGSLEAEYRTPDYHSAAHAADVAQVVTWLLDQGLFDQVTPVQAFALLVAAASHDVGHPGLNNAHLVATESDAAQRWNDVSVNENGHLHTALRLLREHGVFEGEKAYNNTNASDIHTTTSFTREERIDFFSLMRRLILSTDMEKHTQNIADFIIMAESEMAGAAPAAERPEDGDGIGVGIGDDDDDDDSEEEYFQDAYSEYDDNDTPMEVRAVREWSDPGLALCYILHCADISNPARPFHVAKKWGEKITEEFFKQGDRERALGMRVLDFCDRTKANPATVAKNQVNFMDFVCKPTIEALTTILPQAAECMLFHIEKNREKYEDIIKEQQV